VVVPLLRGGQAAAMQARLNRDTLDSPTYFGEPHTRARDWMDVCRNPRLLDAIEACIGEDIILVFSSFFIKPADGRDGQGDEAQVAWHQDNNYWSAVHGTVGVITVWIAIDDASADDCGGSIQTPALRPAPSSFPMAPAAHRRPRLTAYRVSLESDRPGWGR
jgi:hypothetical protein